jgi:hypothetical protein
MRYHRWLWRTVAPTNVQGRWRVMWHLESDADKLKASLEEWLKEPVELRYSRDRELKD